MTKQIVAPCLILMYIFQVGLAIGEKNGNVRGAIDVKTNTSYRDNRRNIIQEHADKSKFTADHKFDMGVQNEFAGAGTGVGNGRRRRRLTIWGSFMRKFDLLDIFHTS